MVHHDPKSWLRKFYHGTFLVKGWNARMEEILAQVSTDQKAVLKNRLTDLGAKIGPEWAKENRARRIDTQMLQSWGDKLRRCRNANPEQLTVAIEEIEAEVDLILSA
jgi:hypothetical protein